MNCINTVKLPFSATINVPDGFYYNDENQLSVAVSTDDLNLYVVEESFITNELINPCTDEKVSGVSVIVEEVRMSGTIAFRLGLNALISSYNFMLGSQTNINDDGWSSTDGFVPVKTMDRLVSKDYVVVGYLDPSKPLIPPTRDDVTVILQSFNVTEHSLKDETILDITGEISFIVSM